MEKMKHMRYLLELLILVLLLVPTTLAYKMEPGESATKKSQKNQLKFGHLLLMRLKITVAILLTLL